RVHDVLCAALQERPETDGEKEIVRVIGLRDNELQAVELLWILLFGQRVLVAERAGTSEPGGVAAAIGRAVVRAGVRAARDHEMHVLLDVGHDVEAFVRESTTRERSITLELIEQIEKQKGGRKVALRVFTLTAGPAMRRCDAPLSNRCSNFTESAK